VLVRLLNGSRRKKEKGLPSETRSEDRREEGMPVERLDRYIFLVSNSVLFLCCERDAMCRNFPALLQHRHRVRS